MIDQLSDADLVAFRNRMLMASQRGYSVARSDEYMELLASEGGAEPPEGSEEGSAAHLFALADAALEARTGGGEKKKSTHKKNEPKKAPPPPPSAPAHKAKDKDESHAKKKAEPEPKVEASYDGWTKEELYAEAQDRDIPNRSTMTKEELITALEEDDAAEDK